MSTPSPLLKEHLDLTRRHFLQVSAAGVGALAASPLWAQDANGDRMLADAIAELEYLTPESAFVGGGRGSPPPHELPEAQRRAVGLERDTWQLEVIADPTSDVQLENALSKELGTALDWSGLMALAESHAVRYMKAMTCLNVDQVFGMGLWEGVPLRHVIWKRAPSPICTASGTTAITATKPTRAPVFKVPCRSTAYWKIRPGSNRSFWLTR